MVVAAGSIYSESFKTVRKLINENRVILSGCYPAFPKKPVTYPLCTVIVDEFLPTQRRFGGNRSAEINIEIVCFTNNAKQLDEISNEVDLILTQNQAVTQASGLRSLVLTSAGIEHPVIDDIQTHARPMMANYKWTGDF